MLLAHQQTTRRLIDVGLYTEVESMNARAHVIRAVVTKVLLAIVPLLLGTTVYAQESQDDGDRHYREVIQKHHAELARACSLAMTNMLSQLKGLAQQYPVLSDIGSASPVKKQSPDSCNNDLLYLKNVHFVPINYPPGVQAPQMASKRIVENGGVVLTIDIMNIDEPVVGKTYGVFYPLLSEGAVIKIHLSYDLQLNPPDPALEKSVKDIVESQVEGLRKNFREILGIDPVEERLRACGEAMTNILGGLQMLAQQFPAWKDIASATIEHKGEDNLYSHLRYWKNAAAVAATNGPPSQGQALGDNPVVERGGVALDVYILKAKQPLNFEPDQRYCVLSDYKAESLIDLVYKLSFPPGEPANSTTTVYDVIQKQSNALREAMRHMIDFQHFN